MNDPGILERGQFSSKGGLLEEICIKFFPKMGGGGGGVDSIHAWVCNNGVLERAINVVRVKTAEEFTVTRSI